MAVLAASALPFRVKAVYEYSSPHDDDLSFSNGQIITVTDEEDTDWYYGEYSDVSGAKKQGLFPKNFVEKYEPTTPPRPTRPARPKKDTETEAHSGHDRSKATEKQTKSQAQEPPTTVVQDQPVVPSPSTNLSLQLVEEPPITQAVKPVNKPKPSPLPKPDSNTVDSGGSSFRDRIAAFNKPAAPVTPAKPSGLGSSSNSNFVKKPYVAPPPMRNSYVPPPREIPAQKLYRREEQENEIVHASSTNAVIHNTNGPQLDSKGEIEEEPAKPTSLKDRIALLQKQQLEQATRHADAAKKEKPKRPPKKRMDAHDAHDFGGDSIEHEDLEKINSTEGAKQLHNESTEDESEHYAQFSTRLSKSKEATPLASPIVASRDSLNDPNDADQSGAGDEEDGEDVSTGKDDSDERSFPKGILSIHHLIRAPELGDNVAKQASDQNVNNEEYEEDPEDDDDDEAIDPEVKRRMEIRERMAKMSGGMGMAGMFGAPGGMPSIGPKKQMTSGSGRGTGNYEAASHADMTQAQNPTFMALPGMSRVRSPEEGDSLSGTAKEDKFTLKDGTQKQESEEMLDSEDVSGRLTRRSRHSEESSGARLRRDPSIPAPVTTLPGAPPLSPIERPVPPPPTKSRVLPPLTVSILPSPGSESENEQPKQNKRLSLKSNPSEEHHPVRDLPAPPPRTPHALPPRPDVHRHTSLYPDEQNVPPESTQTSPIIPERSSTSAKRSSRMPPVPGSAPSLPVASSPRNRAPMPPLPTSAAPSRKSTAPITQSEDNEEEITEYDGDDDTDTVSGVTYRDGSISHVRDPNIDEVAISDEYHHQGLPSLGPPPLPSSSAPRAVPPPPPNQPPKHSRKSSDMPRAPPPPPPPVPCEDDGEAGGGEDDSYDYNSSKQNVPPVPLHKFQKEESTAESQTQFDDQYDVSPPQAYTSAWPSDQTQAPQSYTSSPVVPPILRQSLDVPRATGARRSTDAPRVSGKQDFIANEVDLGWGSQWWLQRNLPPPALQNRMDINVEMAESMTAQQEGGQVVIRHVFVLFMDYSQTIITARFDMRDPSNVELQQRHEPPPPRLRQDQLEDAHTKLGARIADMANKALNSSVGDGSPFALVTGLTSSLSSVLPPVGMRAYGALVYVNLANASVQQQDEIRGGDIISFRNAKIQGHRGPMKQKYNMEVGKPDHVAVVVDWDGTKKKVRAWEQGRESKKVKIESFKLGDLRSGEVKVWRVMSRGWVGWERRAK